MNIIKFMYQLGVDPQTKDKINQTSLYYAARERKFKCCKFLVECGVPLNEKDLYSQSPLYYAAREGATDICQLFIDNGADVNLEDKYGQIALFYAIKNSHDKTVELLIKSGSDVNKTDKKKLTPYQFAIKHNRAMIAEMLINHGATAQSQDKRGRKEKKRKSAEDETTKIEDKTKKYVLIRIDGTEKSRLSKPDVEGFLADHENVARLLQEKEYLDKLESEADDKLRYVESWEKLAKKAITSLWRMRESELFHRPVDPIELGIPDYFTIIKEPMDFSTIKKKLNAGLYSNFKEFQYDIDLVFNNCILYNGVSKD